MTIILQKIIVKMLSPAVVLGLSFCIFGENS